MRSLRVVSGTVAMVAAVLLPWGAVPSSADGSAHKAPPRTVTVPEADQFTPYAITINAGDTVRWVNQDTDNHTVVSDDAFNTAGHKSFDQLLVGTEENGGTPGTLELRFTHAGTFVYYCRFHAHLDAQNQPVAPGPDGGIQDANGNFGTPMTGIITVRGDD